MAKRLHPTRKSKSTLSLIEHPQGISGREIDMKYFINSGRNEVAELERLHGIQILKTEVLNGTGNGYHLVYALPNREEAQKAINVLNHERLKCDEPPLTDSEAEQYLSRFRG